jgi:DNA-binding CsgD family transcriptional regulator
MPGRAVAIVFVNDPDEKQASPVEVLRALFNLTPAETKLAISLMDGNSLSESADLNQVGRETVRSQIKSIFQKTGTKRQGELIRLLALIPYANKLRSVADPLNSP